MNTPGIVLNFGCPRSGTTLLYKVLGQAEPTVLVSKLIEGIECHPAQSERGLIHLSGMFKRRPLILVRIKRHPMEIVESFLATRRDPARFGALAENSDEDIVQWIRSESDGFHAQQPELLSIMDERSHHHLVEVRYEDLVERGHLALRAVAEQLPHEVTFGVPAAPVRAGRLSDGVDRVATDEQKAWFRGRVQDIIEREEYE